MYIGTNLINTNAKKKKIIIKKVSYIHVNDLSIFFLVYTINLIDEN